MSLFDTTGTGTLVEPSVPPSDRERVATRVRAPAWSVRTFALAVAWLLVVAVVAFAIWPLTGTIVPWDSKNQFYPMYRFLGEALRHGAVPLWNPYQFGGYPSAADPQSLIFTPSIMVFALVLPQASMRVFDAIVFGHLVMGGIGILGLARRWRWHPAAGLLTALIFMLGGAASSRLEHTGMIVSYGFFPLAFWSLQAAMDRRSLRLAFVAGLFATLMALGRDQVAFLLCLALAGAVVRQVLRADDWRAYLRARAPVVLVAGLVTLVLMAVPILLALQFVHGSNRPGITYGTATAASLDPINLLTLVAPNMFGSLDGIRDYWGPGAGTLVGIDWTDPTVDYLFAGTLPFVLIIWHGLAGGRLLERGARYFVSMMVAALVYALGRHTGLFSIAYDWLPGVALYRRPADASFLVNIAIAFLSGYLLHRFIEEGAPKLTLLRSPIAILPVMTAIAFAWLVGAGLAFARHAGHLDKSLAAFLSAIGLVLAAGLVLVLLRTRKHRPLAAMILVLATAGQLVWRNVASALNAEPISWYSANADLLPEQARGIAALKADIAARAATGAHPRVEVQGIDGPWQNAAEILKLENTAGYNPLRISAYERAVGVGESTNDPMLRSFPDTFRGYNSRLAAMLGLDYLVLDKPIAALPRFYPRPHANLLFQGDQFFVYRLLNTQVPRAYVAARVLPVDSDDVIDDGEIPSFDISQAALVDRADVGSLQAPSLSADARTATGPGPTSKAEITAYSNNTVTVSVDAAQPGLLVLHDMYYPGWVARVDGAPTPIVRANLLFRGVEVAAGHHTVEFSFQPFSLTNLAAAVRGLHRDGS